MSDDKELRTAILQGFDKIKAAEAELSKAESTLAHLEMRAGQNCISVRIGDEIFSLTSLRRESSYMPVPVPEVERLRQHCILAMKDRVIRRKMTVEGAKHSLAKLLKGITE